MSLFQKIMITRIIGCCFLKNNLQCNHWLIMPISKYAIKKSKLNTVVYILNYYYYFASIHGYNMSLLSILINKYSWCGDDKASAALWLVYHSSQCVIFAVI